MKSIAAALIIAIFFSSQSPLTYAATPEAETIINEWFEADVPINSETQKLLQLAIDSANEDAEKFASDVIQISNLLSTTGPRDKNHVMKVAFQALGHRERGTNRHTSVIQHILAKIEPASPNTLVANHLFFTGLTFAAAAVLGLYGVTSTRPLNRDLPFVYFSLSDNLLNAAIVFGALGAFTFFVIWFLEVSTPRDLHESQLKYFKSRLQDDLAPIFRDQTFEERVEKALLGRGVEPSLPQIREIIVRIRSRWCLETLVRLPHPFQPPPLTSPNSQTP